MVRAQVCFAALFAVRCVGEPEPLATLISRALEAHQRGDAAQAATLYDAVLVRETELTPTVAAQLLGNAGALALVRGERATALRVFSRAVETTPDSAEARVNFAIALNQFGEHDEALSHAQKAVALAPLYAKAHQALAACYQDVGSERAAQRHWGIAEALAEDGADLAAGELARDALQDVLLFDRVGDVGPGEDGGHGLRRGFFAHGVWCVCGCVWRAAGAGKACRTWCRSFREVS